MWRSPLLPLRIEAKRCGIKRSGTIRRIGRRPSNNYGFNVFYISMTRGDRLGLYRTLISSTNSIPRIFFNAWNFEGSFASSARIARAL
jgi:hypothetical protein